GGGWVPRRPGAGEADPPPAVPDIEDDPALLGRFRRAEQLAILHDVVARAAVGVRQDVAGAQEIEEIRDRARRRPDVAHDGHALADHLRRPAPSPPRLTPPSPRPPT